MLTCGPFPIRRLGRRLLWAHPTLYRWFGILRNRGDCLADDFDIWIGGYPRSANSFATAVFKLGNPKVRVATHLHIPTFIINALRLNKPGVLLVRKPIDAAVSWAIFWEGQMKLEHALNYYIDFHRVLMPFRDQLFIASFDQAISNFGLVVSRFNCKFGTGYSALAQSDARGRCISYVEDWFRGPDGSLNEFRVPRPSLQRADLKSKLLRQVQDSARLSKKTAIAEGVYRAFCTIEETPCSPQSQTEATLRLMES